MQENISIYSFKRFFEIKKNRQYFIFHISDVEEHLLSNFDHEFGIVSQTRVSVGNRTQDPHANSLIHYPLDYQSTLFEFIKENKSIRKKMLKWYKKEYLESDHHLKAMKNIFCFFLFNNFFSWNPYNFAFFSGIKLSNLNLLKTFLFFVFWQSVLTSEVSFNRELYKKEILGTVVLNIASKNALLFK